MNKRCVVNFAVRGRENYPMGQRRLRVYLEGRSDSDVLCWLADDIDNREGYPAGSPTHNEVPYAFKYHAIQAAFDKGYESVFWLDSSVVPRKNLEPLWKIIEERGILAFRNAGCLESYFTSEDCLNILGCSIEEANGICQISGGIVGYNKNHHEGMKIFEKMRHLAIHTSAFQGGSNTSSFPKYQSHRHDQSCLSYLLHQHGIEVETSGLDYTGSVNDNTILELRAIV